MSNKAIEILKNVYLSYSQGEDYYKMKAPLHLKYTILIWLLKKLINILNLLKEIWLL